MKVKYLIEAVEEVENNINLKPKELTKLKQELESKIEESLKYAGFNLAASIKLELDLIGDDDIETW